ncbi:hypothetical protein PR048_009446 [Dryococelus australis]|uniref:Integrase zinc-binding domain-containing protein n=1 Tax=Dryococelus australis TaxID=614101 RepID=A0ABQ9I0M8_9NEOP|nr:hypothetical protein PR048_009446 [Dryococelus australis]
MYKECDKLKDAISLGTSPNYVIDKELIYYVDKYKRKKVFVLKKAINLVLKYVHDTMRGAYMGRAKTKAVIKREFFWPGMSTNIDKNVKAAKWLSNLRIVKLDYTQCSSPLDRRKMCLWTFMAPYLDLLMGITVFKF